MTQIFKTADTRKVVDIAKHTMEELRKCPYVEIHVGTDSQNSGRTTTFSTVIAYRYPGRGVHYIESTQRVPKIRDKWTRLWKEAEMTIQVADKLTEQVSVKVELDFDFNIDEKYFSSKLVQSTSGWASSLGYKVNLKPDNQVATRAADHRCR